MAGQAGPLDLLAQSRDRAGAADGEAGDGNAAAAEERLGSRGWPTYRTLTPYWSVQKLGSGGWAGSSPGIAVRPAMSTGIPTAVEPAAPQPPGRGHGPDADEELLAGTLAEAEVSYRPAAWYAASSSLESDGRS